MRVRLCSSFYRLRGGGRDGWMCMNPSKTRDLTALKRRRTRVPIVPSMCDEQNCRQFGTRSRRTRKGESPRDLSARGSRSRIYNPQRLNCNRFEISRTLQNNFWEDRGSILKWRTSARKGETSKYEGNGSRNSCEPKAAAAAS